MQKTNWLYTALLLATVILFPDCKEQKTENAVSNFGGYESQVKWGEHLLLSGDYTPKKMSQASPVVDSALLFSGHPAQMPLPDFTSCVIFN